MDKFKRVLVSLAGFLFLFFSHSFVYSKKSNISLDTLKYYRCRLDNYKYKDSSYYDNIKQELNLFNKQTTNHLSLFLVNSILADIYRLNGEYNQAIKSYFKALEHSEYIEEKKEIAKVYDHLIFIYRVRGEADRMFEIFDKVVALKRDLGDIRGIYNTELMVGYYYRRVGYYMQAFKKGYDALEYAENNKDTTLILYAYNFISMTYKVLGNYDKAMQIFDLTNKYLDNDVPNKNESTIYNGKGTVQLKLGEYQSALNNFLKSIEIEKEIGNKFRILTRYNNMGITYSYLKNFDVALNYFRICINEYEKSGRWRDLSNIYNSVGMCYEEMNWPDSSIHYYIKSIKICEKYEYKELYMKSALWVSKMYDKKGLNDSAYIYLKKYNELYNLINKSNLAWQVTAEEYEHIRKKEKKLAEVERKNRLFQNIIISGLLVLIILVFWIIILKQKSKIQNSKIAKQELEEQEQELKNKISLKNKELVSKILQLSDHNSGINFAVQRLKELKLQMGINSKQKVQQVINDLEHSVNNNIWQEFEHRFIDVHPKLHNKLSLNYPGLTINERRLCALIYLNFSSKEIAHIIKQSHKSILVAKSRLRNKLGISDPDKIIDLLHELTGS